MRPLTYVQRQQLATYARLRVELGHWPSIREFAEACGLSCAVGQHAHTIMRVFAEKGCITLGPHGSKRTGRLTYKGWRLAGVEPPPELTPPKVPVDGSHRCPTCDAETFKVHDPRTCAQLLTGLTFAELARADEATRNGGAFGRELRP